MRPPTSPEQVCSCCEHLSEDVKELQTVVRGHDKAIMVGVGEDGKNGRLSHTSREVEKVSRNLVWLQRELVVTIIAVLLAVGANVYSGCIKGAEVDARIDERMLSVERWRSDWERRFIEGCSKSPSP